MNSFCLNPSEEFCSYLISTIHCIMLKWGAKNKRREREIKNGKKPRTGNVGADRSWAQVKFCFHFSFSRSPCMFPVPRSPFPVPRSPFPVPRSPFPVPRSPFPVPLSLLLVSWAFFPYRSTIPDMTIFFSLARR